MPVFKNEGNGSWYVMARYVNWKGERKQKCKRGFATKREAQEWERKFQLQNSADLDMDFEAFAELYTNDVKSWSGTALSGSIRVRMRNIYLSLTIKSRSGKKRLFSLRGRF